MHDAKVPFFMPELSSIKIIQNRFHFDKNKGKSGIGYNIIIGCDLMVQLVLSAGLNHQVLQWYGVTVTMKEPSGLLGQSDITSRNMRKLVMQTAELFLTR